MKKKTKKVLWACGCAACITAGGVMIGGNTGAYADENVVLINTKEDFQQIQNNMKGSYKLGADIDLTGVDWKPIGSYEKSFQGTFDGGGYTIRNLTVDDSDDFAGLFACIGLKGEVKNLIVDGATVKGNDNVGVITGMNRGLVQNCYVTSNANVEGRKNVAGVVGDNVTGKMTYCMSDATVTGDTNVGGLAGDTGNSGSSKGIINSCAGGKVTGEENVGGITGSAVYGSIVSSYTAADIEARGTGKSVGGAVGKTGAQKNMDGVFYLDEEKGTGSSIGEAVSKEEIGSEEFEKKLEESGGSWEFDGSGKPYPEAPEVPIKPIEPGDPTIPWTPIEPAEPIEPDRPSNGGSSSGSSSSHSVSRWEQSPKGWRYREGGSYVISAWKCLGDEQSWYYFNAEGYMATGWQFVDNNWYYLNPVSDGTQGKMMTGWQFVDGNWYYLNPVSDGTRGKMMTGWQNINEKWYYFNEVSDGTRGAMYSNRVTPDGYQTGADGVRQ